MKTLLALVGVVALTGCVVSTEPVDTTPVDGSVCIPAVSLTYLTPSSGEYVPSCDLTEGYPIVWLSGEKHGSGVVKGLCLASPTPDGSACQQVDSGVCCL